MGRLYTVLKCGCNISCDGGGGLVPCEHDGINPECEASDYIKEHKTCKVCGDCMICCDHGDCVYKTEDLLFDMEMFLEEFIEISTELNEEYHITPQIEDLMDLSDQAKELLQDVKKRLDK